MIQLIKEADDLIRKVVSRYNGLYTQYGKVSQIELDLMLDELRQLYEKFKVIGQLNIMPQAGSVEKPVQRFSEPTVSKAQPVTPPQPESEESKPLHAKEEPQVKHMQPEQYQAPDENVAESAHEATETIPAKQELQHVPEQEPAAEKPLPPQPAEIHPAPKPKAEPSPKPAKTSKPVIQPETPKPTLADTFRTEQKSLSDTIIASPADSSISSRLQAQPISDLKAAIGLNERFNFISELFGNDLLGYDEAIKIINNASGVDEAMKFLAELHEKYQWNDSIPSLARFTDFVHRRFL